MTAPVLDPKELADQIVTLLSAAGLRPDRYRVAQAAAATAELLSVLGVPPATVALVADAVERRWLASAVTAERFGRDSKEGTR